MFTIFTHHSFEELEALNFMKQSVNEQYFVRSSPLHFWVLLWFVLCPPPRHPPQKYIEVLIALPYYETLLETVIADGIGKVKMRSS